MMDLTSDCNELFVKTRFERTHQDWFNENFRILDRGRTRLRHPPVLFDPFRFLYLVKMNGSNP